MEKSVNCKVVNLGSSSEGNSFILEIQRTKYDTPFVILLEMGFTATELKRRMFDRGYSLNDINVGLVTHEHNDHSIALKEFRERGIKTYAPQSVFNKYDIEIENDYIIKEFTEKVLGDGIKAFGIPLEHENDDGTLVENYAYVITIENSYRILFVTDTKHIKYDLSKFRFDLIIIESNNFKDVLYYQLKNAEEKNDKLKIRAVKRVMRSHMSVENTAKTLATFDLSNTKAIFLIHLSSGTLGSQTFKFREVIVNHLKKENKRIPKVFVCDKRGNIT